MALLRELERLIERKKELQSELSVIQSLFATVPARLKFEPKKELLMNLTIASNSEFASRISAMQESFSVAGPSRALSLAEVSALSLPLRTVYLHLSAYAEANLTAQVKNAEFVQSPYHSILLWL